MLFPTTHWSQLIKLSQDGDGLARESLDKICRAYWQPVFVVVRGRGVTDQDAGDVTQAFFEHALEKMAFARADRLRGRFRTFLLGILHHFLLSEWRDATAAKRGGGVLPGEFDDETAPSVPPVEAESFDREWALAVMNRAVERVRDEWSDKGKNWNVLKRFLPGGGGALSMEEAAEKCGTTPGAFKVELHRLRARMKELLRGEIARTVSAPHEIEEELAYLRRTLEGA